MAVRVDDIPLATDEPFGMRGVSLWLRPLIASLFLLAAIGCAVMGPVSERYQYSLVREAGGSFVWVESIYGHLQFAYAANDDDRAAADYNVYARELSPTRRDASYNTPLGVGSGVETRRFRFSGVSYPTQYVRIRWAVLAVLMVVWPAISFIRALRRRWARHAEA